MKIIIEEASVESLADLSRVDGRIFVDSRACLYAEDGQISWKVAPVEPYVKPYIPDHDDYTKYIGAEDKVIYFARVDGCLAGQIILSTWWNGFASVDDIAVDLAYRRFGVGRALMQQAVGWAKQAHLPGIRLEAQDVNLAACCFYNKFGFQLAGFDRRLYAANPGVSKEIALYWYLIF